MASYDYVTVDVFTRTRFGGNPLAVFPDARGIDGATMQALAAELNYSETTFVLPAEDPANSARVRIFNRNAEMPFAGHPNVGTAYVLARLGRVAGTVLRFEELAGIVEVRLTDECGHVVGAEIDAPQVLTLGRTLPVSAVAECVSLPRGDIVVAGHAPVVASVGVDFTLVEVLPAALAEAVPDLGAYRRLSAATPELAGRLSVFLYAVEGAHVRARMFAPLAGTWEDPATGSANATVAALRLHVSGGDRLAYNAVQGVEMGRPSHLALRAWQTPEGVRASVGGQCIDMFRGTVIL